MRLQPTRQRRTRLKLDVSLATARLTGPFEETVKFIMNEEKITLEFKYPWTMMPLENAEEWIEAVSKSLKKTDPLYGKDIFVSGRHELENLILVDNDTDGNYAVMSFEVNENTKSVECNTIEVFASRKTLAQKLLNDHDEVIKHSRHN